MRVVVTGGAGFIGRNVVRRLAARGDQVVALVRDPSRATHIEGPGVALVANDLSGVAPLTAPMSGADAVIHLAGWYEIGIPAADRPRMRDANVGATERVLDAAIASKVPRIVYASTANVYGNTRGVVVDETYRRDPADGFLSYYDETKWLAHQAAERRIADGAPVMIVLPGTVYGIGDHSAVGAQLKGAHDGSLAFLALGGVGVSPVHVEDLAAGVVGVLERGRPGVSYDLAGENMHLREAMKIAARSGGRRLPRITIADPVLRIGAALGPGLGGMFGLPPNLREIASASLGVTYWADSGRARAEVGYATRDLAEGFVDAYGPPVR